MQRLRLYQTDATRRTSRDLPRQGRGASREARGEDRADSRDRTGADPEPENPADRRRRRAVFLAELAEPRRLRARVAPRRARNARLREALRMNTFRW